MTLRRLALSAAFALVLPLTASAASQNIADIPGGHYVLDKRHSSLTAKVLHMGVSLYTVRFDIFDASFDYEPAHLETTRLKATVDPASMDNNAPGSQQNSKEFAEQFLTASKFPQIAFTATALQKTSDTGGTMTGDMTFLGVTKPVTFDVTFVGTGRELMNPLGRTAGFSAVAHIKRSDFGSTYLNNLVGDDVTIDVEGEFDRK
jgi:polyisoprenoid-binding protein YceI